MFIELLHSSTSSFSNLNAPMIPVNDRFRITDEGERYLLVTYLIMVLLSSLIGDSLIILASVRYNAIKLNKFIIAVMQHMAVGDLLRSTTCILPVIVSLIADEWITNTKSLAKEFSKILIFEYFGCMKVGFDVFFDADSESPRMT